jgi:hypothetical protein
MSKWTAWTFQINSKSFKNIRPLSIELARETRLIIWLKNIFTKAEILSPRWYISLTYDRGPVTKRRQEKVFFDKEEEARYWYNNVFREVFLAKTNKNKTPPKKKTPLRLI